MPLPPASPRTRFARFGALAAALVVVFAAGCTRVDKPKTIKEIRKGVREPVTDQPISSAQRFGYSEAAGGDSSSGGATATSAAGGEGYAWTLPHGWKSIPATSQFRKGNFEVPGAPGVVCYISILRGTGGGVAPNVNRWAHQMSRSPLTQAQLSALHHIQVLGRSAVVADFSGTYKGMSGDRAASGTEFLGVIVPDVSSAIFVVMHGPQNQVAAQRDAFFQLCRSLRRTEGGATAEAGMPATPRGPARGGPGFQWEAPAGWTKGPNDPGHAVTYHPGGDAETECYIATPSASATSVVGVVKGWRAAFGESSLSQGEIDALPDKAVVFGGKVPIVRISGTYTDKAQNKHPGYMILGAVRKLPFAAIVIEMVGPEKVVKSQVEAFKKFCESLHL